MESSLSCFAPSRKTPSPNLPFLAAVRRDRTINGEVQQMLQTVKSNVTTLLSSLPTLVHSHRTGKPVKADPDGSARSQGDGVQGEVEGGSGIASVAGSSGAGGQSSGTAAGGSGEPEPAGRSESQSAGSGSPDAVLQKLIDVHARAKV